MDFEQLRSVTPCTQPLSKHVHIRHCQNAEVELERRANLKVLLSQQ